MATVRKGKSDSFRWTVYERIASAGTPIRASRLGFEPDERRNAQKHIERARKEMRSKTGGDPDNDDELLRWVRQQLELQGPPTVRGAALLAGLGAPEALAFRARLGWDATVIGDWVEIAHSPEDAGWTSEQISVLFRRQKTLFERGDAGGWLTEKKRFLEQYWQDVRRDPTLRRRLLPNQLKMDVVAFNSLGTLDSTSPTASFGIQVAPVDWQTAVALNMRLESATVSDDRGMTIRQLWGTPNEIAERRGLPGMVVGHVVVETRDEQLLVCQRQVHGMEDEPGAWSLSIEERWSGALPAVYDRKRRRVTQQARPADPNPHALVARAVREELGLAVDADAIRILSWGVETSVLYPGFIALAKTRVPSWEVPAAHATAADPNEVRAIAWIPARVDSLRLLLDDAFAPRGSESTAPWHRTSKARLFTALAHVLARNGHEGRGLLLEELGKLSV